MNKNLITQEDLDGIFEELAINATINGEEYNLLILSRYDASAMFGVEIENYELKAIGKKTELENVNHGDVVVIEKTKYKVVEIQKMAVTTGLILSRH